MIQAEGGIKLTFPERVGILNDDGNEVVNIEWRQAIVVPDFIGDWAEWECFRTIPGSRIPPEIIDWDFLAQVDEDSALITADKPRWQATLGSRAYYEGNHKARRSRAAIPINWHYLTAAIKFWSQNNTSGLSPWTGTQHGTNQDVSCGIIIYPRKRGSGTVGNSNEPGELENEAALLEASVEAMLANREAQLGLTSGTGFIGSDEMGNLGAHLLGQVTSHTVAGQVYGGLDGYAGRFNDAVGAVGVPTWTYTMGFGPNQIQVDMAQWVPGHPDFPWSGWYVHVKGLLTVIISGWGFWRLWLMFAPATVIPGWQRGSDGD